VEAIRATLQRIYSRFELHRGPIPAGLSVDDADALEAGDYLITMDVRDDAPVEYDTFTGQLSGRESIAPTLKQTFGLGHVAGERGGHALGLRRW
jgi:hypothetical protein